MKKHVYSSLLALSVVLGCLSLSACRGGSILDRKAPFGSKVVRFGDVEVATVDGTAIYLSDVEQLARANGKLADGQPIDVQAPIFHSTLRQLVDQRVLGLAAITESLDQTDIAKRRLAAAREQLYGRFVIENIISTKVTDEDIQRLYEEQRLLNDQGEERRARQIIVDTQEEAEKIVERLENGEDFGTLASILSLDKATLNNGGDLGYFSQGLLDGEVAKVTFATPLNVIAPIFETEEGFHILEVTGSRMTPQKSFEELEPQLREYLTYEAINQTIKDLRRRSDIRLRVATGTKAPLDIPTERVKEQPADKVIADGATSKAQSQE